VVKPHLSDWSFSRAVAQAQAAFDQCNPDVVVGSSRGSVLAMHVTGDDVPRILLCPPWRHFGHIDRIQGRAIVLHGTDDTVVSLADSIELCRRSQNASLVIVGDDHRLNGPEGSEALRMAVRTLLAESIDGIPSSATLDGSITRFPCPTIRH